MAPRKTGATLAHGVHRAVASRHFKHTADRSQGPARQIGSNMRRIGTLLAFCVIASPVRPALALEAHKPGPDWQQARNDKQMAIFFRDDAKLKAREINAITEMNAAPATIFHVVTDFDSYAKFMPYTKEVRVLERPAGNQAIIQTLVTPPIGAWRDSVSTITMTPGTPENGGVYRSEWLAKPNGAPLRKGIVRVQLNKGYWNLEPIDGGRRTRATYSILTNPGGNMPQWLINQGNNIGIPQLFDAVGKRATAQEKDAEKKQLEAAKKK